MFTPIILFLLTKTHLPQSSSTNCISDFVELGQFSARGQHKQKTYSISQTSLKAMNKLQNDVVSIVRKYSDNTSLVKLLLHSATFVQ